MKPNKKTILIIGGMGPTASLYVHKKIIEKCSNHNVVNNSDYPGIIHISINVPDFISQDYNTAKDSLKYIENKLLAINFDTVDCGLIACNTAHSFFNEINDICQGKLSSIIEITSRQVIDNDKVGIVCTPFTLENNIYGNNKLIYPSKEDMVKSELLIRDVIANNVQDETVANFKNIINNLSKSGCKKIIIGCSELSILADFIKGDYDESFIIDPIDLLIEEIVAGVYEK